MAKQERIRYEIKGKKSSKMIGPLTIAKADMGSLYSPDVEEHVQCLKCEQEFLLPGEGGCLLSHLQECHNITINSPHTIASLKMYIEYWRRQLMERKCSYQILGEQIDEDRQLREHLQQKRLKWVLEQQAWERKDTNYSHGCLFCHKEFNGCRSDFLHHLAQQHNLQLGHPENLVFIDQLIEVVQHKLESLLCLYCERTFKDRAVLKEHMRKKMHKRINPFNQEYDRFYIVNYLELGKDWQHVQNERDDDLEDGAGDWSDWCEEESIEPIVCLFCKKAAPSFENVLDHMHAEHGWDHILEFIGLNFYQQVKLVNYFRRQISCGHCPGCDTSVGKELLAHMTTASHFILPPRELWDQPEFYFPTYENDSFLCHLEDYEDDTIDSMDNNE